MNDFRLAKDVRPTRYALQFDLDLEGWTFTAKGRIGLTLTRPARDITLHSVDLAIKTGDDIAGVTYDGDSQTATLKLGRELPAGTHDLTLEWSGAIAENRSSSQSAVRGARRRRRRSAMAPAANAICKPEKTSRW